MRNVSDKNCRENQNTRFMFKGFFFWQSCRLWDKVEKYCRAGQATEDNMAQMHCMLYTQGYKNTLRICNIYCFSTATIAARTRFNVALFSNRLNTPWQSYTVWNSETVVTQTINIKQTSEYKTGTFRNFKRQQIRWILIISSLSWKANSHLCSQEILQLKEQKFPCRDHSCPAVVPVLGYLLPFHAIYHCSLNTV